MESVYKQVVNLKFLSEIVKIFMLIKLTATDAHLCLHIDVNLFSHKAL